MRISSILHTCNSTLWLPKLRLYFLSKKKTWPLTRRYLESFGLRNLAVEFRLLFMAAFGMALIMRLLYAPYIASASLPGQPNSMGFYAFLQDLLSAVLVLCGAFFIGLFCFHRLRWRFAAWAFYLFVIGLGYLGNLRYLRVYTEHFSWNHLKAGTLNGSLWTSLWAELDHSFWLQLLSLGLSCLLWFFLGLKTNSSANSCSAKAASFPRQGFARLLLFCMSLILFFFMSSISIAEPSLPLGVARDHIGTAQFLQHKNQTANVLLRLSFQQNQAAPPMVTLAADYNNTQLSRPFRFGFDSASREDPKVLPPIPFVRNRQYNIVLYLFESTAYSYLQKRVKDKWVAPGWRKLSQKALVFANHYVHNPLSINSLFSLLTSAYTMPADVWPARKYPGIALQSLPQILKRAGFRNGFLHTGDLSYAGQDKFLKDRGFTSVQDIRHLRSSLYQKNMNWGIDDRSLIAAARKFASAATKSGDSYFLVISPVSPHHPYEVPEEKYRLVPFRSLQANSPLPSLVGQNLQPEQNSFQRRTNFERYLDSLHYADAVMQEIVHTLEALPGGENTLFFILADHGEAFGQHSGNFNHPFYLYEENVHVPFIIYNHKLFKRPVYYRALSRHIDVLPTILDSLSLRVGPLHEGVSLLRGGKPQLASFYTSWRNRLAGIRDGRWKYILNLLYGVEELYDLEKDPQERRNIYRDHPYIVERYRKYLTELHAYQRKYFETVLKESIHWRVKLDKNRF